MVQYAETENLLRPVLQIAVPLGSGLLDLPCIFSGNEAFYPDEEGTDYSVSMILKRIRVPFC